MIAQRAFHNVTYVVSRAHFSGKVYRSERNCRKATQLALADDGDRVRFSRLHDGWSKSRLSSSEHWIHSVNASVKL